MAKVEQLGDNVEASIEKGILTLKIDLKKEGTVSKSGKSIVIGSTKGNKGVDNVVVGLNVYRPNN